MWRFSIVSAGSTSPGHCHSMRTNSGDESVRATEQRKETSMFAFSHSFAQKGSGYSGALSVIDGVALTPVAE